MSNLPELIILKYLLINNNYNKYINYIYINKDFREVCILFDSLKALHSRHPDTDKSVDELEAYVYALYPAMAKSERAAIHGLCETLRSTDVADAIVEDLVSSVVQREAARKAALAALEFSEGRTSQEQLLEAFKAVSAEKVSDKAAASKNWVTSNLHELYQHTVKSGGLYWPLRSLNKSLGPLRKGDFGFVFARPETGKTTFLSHIATHMATQAEKPIVWFNNEEQGEKVRVRTFQSALGVTAHDLFSSIEENEKAYVETTRDRLCIYDDETIHRRDVEKIIAELEPALVIIDQIDKIKGFDADRPDLVFGRIYQWARELSKGYCPIIGTCQADGSGEGVKWLTMSHVAEAKTSKQAEADWILGIGKSNEGGTEDVRFFNISKNKLMGDEQTDPELRHGRFDVWIRPQIARYEDVIDD